MMFFHSEYTLRVHSLLLKLVVSTIVIYKIVSNLIVSMTKYLFSKLVYTVNFYWCNI